MAENGETKIIKIITICIIYKMANIHIGDIAEIGVGFTLFQCH